MEGRRLECPIALEVVRRRQAQCRPQRLDRDADLGSLGLQQLLLLLQVAQLLQVLLRLLLLRLLLLLLLRLFLGHRLVLLLLLLLLQRLSVLQLGLLLLPCRVLVLCVLLLLKDRLRRCILGVPALHRFVRRLLRREPLLDVTS